MEEKKYNLKALRAMRGQTQEEAGESVGVSGYVWGKWERGVSFPDVIEIKAIEEEYNVSYNDIIFLNNNTV
ncbi:MULTISPECIES: helix-turn-helix transcriptional regulator [Aerococcus]|uniref:helix-turn-helix transcriptional regulator n=1 Tax=Aerococcus TaxID=1375 RepID=UPI00215C8B2D|nr:helix-turn-helix transcriptional regulator [Aerococcus urinae]MDL5184524.1 helix-turn-helix transcriptional regulator [Aerococcus mictus]MDK6290893.1 helix-turn-helix transcriptional regulator [Aerococcus urinae]MDK6374738.1 helix-turn-helix transcriptional regulator [Aerococcus urinae]MDK6420237.1 helix-turn-helix transcriptional regulator [Aerococcus urinae]MDK8074613.1 helix-turn-helix transcriptional regulator [Aerococcus urinae]